MAKRDAGEPSEEDLGKRRRQCIATRHETPLYYHDYLALDKILTAQNLMSAVQTEGEADPPQQCPYHPMAAAAKTEEDKEAKGAHDEHLFIIIHQTYELWFKQILWDVADVQRLLDQPYVPERSISVVISRLNRVIEILRLLVDQFTILETMSPLSFLEFRDFLFPASGFQSLQWRTLERSLGLRDEDRVGYGQRSYCSHLTDQHQEMLQDLKAARPTLHDLVNNWLERTPLVDPSTEEFSFWTHYKDGVARMLQQDRDFVLAGKDDTDEGRTAYINKQLSEIDARQEHLDTILNAEKFQEAHTRGEVRFTHKAMQAALVISLYQDEPILNQASRLLRALVDIDELMTMWRQRHSLMVHRMLGVKMGTGGSSGFGYLTQAATKHRVFKDLFNISTFLIPKHELPSLPEQVTRQLTFAAEAKENGK